eukprot:526958-Amphidinium_carterae.1
MVLNYVNDADEVLRIHIRCQDMFPCLVIQSTKPLLEDCRRLWIILSKRSSPHWDGAVVQSRGVDWSTP